MKVALALAALGLGCLTAMATVVLHDITWTLWVAWLSTALTVLALPAGVRGRIPYALGWMAVLGLSVSPNAGGGYLLGSTTSGYCTLALGLVVLSVSIATFPIKRRRRLAGHDQAAGDTHNLAG